jgi:hypothetical protein
MGRRARVLGVPFVVRGGGPAVLAPTCAPGMNRGARKPGKRADARVSGQPSCDAGDADQGAFGVCEVTDNQPIRGSGWTHDPCAAEPFGSLQRSLDLRDPNVEDGVVLVPRSAAHTTADACSILGRDEVQEPVALRLRYCFRHR